MSREAMQMALEALEVWPTKPPSAAIKRVIAELREALAQPDLSVVGYVYSENGCVRKKADVSAYIPNGTPLYIATPPAQPAKPLGNATLMELMPRAIPEEYDGALFEFARAIEAKHGITGETK